MRNLLKWLTPALAAAALLCFYQPSRTQADDAPAAQNGSINGTVVDSNGKGVANIKVRLVKPMAGGGHGQKPGDGGAAPAAPQQAGGHNMPKPIAEATTDANGAFTMANVPAGDYMLLAGDRQSNLRGRAKVTVAAGNTPTTVTITAEAGGGNGGHGQKPGGGAAAPNPN